MPSMLVVGMKVRLPSLRMAATRRNTCRWTKSHKSQQNSSQAKRVRQGMCVACVCVGGGDIFLEMGVGGATISLKMCGGAGVNSLQKYVCGWVEFHTDVRVGRAGG